MPVNCAAIPSNLVESELFGHAKGSFTGASHARAGRFAQADGGTIFLDEIGEMELAVQAKLLRLIQDGELYPVGEEDADHASTCASWPPPTATSRTRSPPGASAPISSGASTSSRSSCPSLRERPTDIVRLAEHFMRKANERHKRHVTGFDPEALAAFKAYSLARKHPRARERHRAAGDRARPAERLASPTCRRRCGRPVRRRRKAMTPIPELPADGTDLRAMLEAVEERMIGEALERTGGNKNRAAELLGLNRTTLVEKLRRKRVA